MNRRPLTTSMLCALIGVLSVQPAVAAAATPSSFERLQSAISEHPSDPDLRWALARNLASSGNSGEAIQKTRDFVARWPDRRPEARIEIARMLIESDASEHAIELLGEELAVNPRSAMAHFYRGLAFRKISLYSEANRAFQIAGSLEPSIRSETLLARALSLFDMGQEDEAVGLLQTILQIDPSGDSAVRARLLLRQRELLDLVRRWRVDGYAGFEWDDNVTLESSENEIPASGRDDWSGIWGVGLTARPWLSERAAVTIGYRYDQSRHADLTDFDVLGNTLFASATWRIDDRLAVRVDGLLGSTLQDLHDELLNGSLRPSLIYSFGPDWGAIRVFGQFEGSEYHDDTVIEQWERDALTFSAGAEHFLPLRMKESWLALSGSWARTLTQADPGGGASGYDGDYDYDSWRIRGIAMLPLPFGLRAQIDGAYNHDRYHNDNFSYLLQKLGEGVAAIDPRKRRDDVLSGRIGLSRAIVDHVRFEIYWRGTRRISNVDVFDYDKQVVGAVMRFSTD